MSFRAEMVNGAATARGEPVLPENVIEEAYSRVKIGIAECHKYPTGEPSLKGIYEIAKELNAHL